MNSEPVIILLLPHVLYSGHLSLPVDYICISFSVFLSFPPLEFKLHEAETLLCVALNSQSPIQMLLKFKFKLFT